MQQHSSGCMAAEDSWAGCKGAEKKNMGIDFFERWKKNRLRKVDGPMEVIGSRSLGLLGDFTYLRDVNLTYLYRGEITQLLSTMDIPVGVGSKY